LLRGEVVDLLLALDVYPSIAEELGEIRVSIKVVGYFLGRGMTCRKPQNQRYPQSDPFHPSVPSWDRAATMMRRPPQI